MRVPIHEWEVDLLVSQTIAALTMATSFGEAVAHGFLRLLGQVSPEQLHGYARRLDEVRREGAGLGQLLAAYLPAVLLRHDDALLEAFEATLATLLSKGVYTVKGPLGLFVQLLDRGEADAGVALLDLLEACFALPLSYNRSIYMTQFIPQAVAGFDPLRRSFQIGQLKRVIQVDHHLAEPFVEGLAAGTTLLSAAALTAFVSRALNRAATSAEGAGRYLSLAAHRARAFCRELQTTVPLTEVRGQLGRYLQARLGYSVAIHDMADLGGADDHMDRPRTLVACDGRYLFLPKELGLYEQPHRNREVYTLLVKLEAACFEFGSFDFDRQRMHQLSGSPLDRGAARDGAVGSDLERFLNGFPQPDLAAGLFTVFEHCRLRLAVAARYPGLARETASFMEQAVAEELALDSKSEILKLLYITVALGMVDERIHRIAGDNWPLLLQWMQTAVDRLVPGSRVEASAALVRSAYPSVEARRGRPAAPRRPFWTPFGRRLRPDLIYRATAIPDRMARRVRQLLASRGLRVFQSDLRKCFLRRQGTPENADLRALILAAHTELNLAASASKIRLELAELDLDALLDRTSAAALPCRSMSGTHHRYPEWDAHLGDYLMGHTLVRERRLPEVSDPLYRRTVDRHTGLVARIRHAFELLKPQGLKLLRPWREGDSFDYRAMLAFAVDRKAGCMPSDRLYVKRIKHQRDVAVLLLVDLSRSTANQVQGASMSVLHVTQTAIILFCEALKIVGDRFAIAGFSSSGRLDVDYLRIKDFDDPLDHQTKRRIAAMTPMRATRMGAAIRHATRRLAEIPAGVRLLLILGDGFPNDTGYKGMRAIADTRRAIQEAHARRIYTRGITVNIGSDARLDELYGRAHHTVIQDVRDLPDRLFEIYGRLTRT